MTTLSETSPTIETQPSLLPESPRVNVGQKERVVLGFAGGLLTFGAGVRFIKHPSLGGFFMGLLGGTLVYRSVTGYCAAYEALGIDNAHRGQGIPSQFFERGVHVQSSITIDRPVDEVFRFWRNFENLPQFMGHLEAVHCTGDLTSHWKAKAPVGSSVEWDAQIINEELNRMIAWRSLAGADVDNAGSVHFTPTRDQHGTEVSVVLEYVPPAGRIGVAVAKLFGEEPEQQVQEDLCRLKQMLETGQMPIASAQSCERCET